MFVKKILKIIFYYYEIKQCIVIMVGFNGNFSVERRLRAYFLFNRFYSREIE